MTVSRVSGWCSSAWSRKDSPGPLVHLSHPAPFAQLSSEQGEVTLIRPPSHSESRMGKGHLTRRVKTMLWLQRSSYLYVENMWRDTRSPFEANERPDEKGDRVGDHLQCGLRMRVGLERPQGEMQWQSIERTSRPLLSPRVPGVAGPL